MIATQHPLSPTSRKYPDLLSKSSSLFSTCQTNSNLSVRNIAGHRFFSISATYQSFPVSYLMTIVVPLTENHDVFISYRGDEVGYNFVSHLIAALERHGIKFFVDKDEQRGKDLTHLFVRIEESKIGLVIFSTRYPESKWCLSELVKMKALADEGKLLLIPIFYKVEARDVRKPTRDSEFGWHFWKLVEASDLTDPIEDWRKALDCISNKMGLSLGHNSSEADFIKKIVKEVQRVMQAIKDEEE